MAFSDFIEPSDGYVNLRFVLDTQVPSFYLYLLESVNEEKIVNYSIHVALVLRPFVLHLFVLALLPVYTTSEFGLCHFRFNALWLAAHVDTA
jgi:hypothetical protein